jgi:serine-type D-Ala-D-Ala carboxypeptidase/endopeptidase
MRDTGVTAEAEERNRLTIGSGISGAASVLRAPCADSAATGGNGGLYGTGEDMALWLRHNLDTSDPALLLSHAIHRSRQSMIAAIGFDDSGLMAGIGLGWVMIATHDHRPMPIEKGDGGGFLCCRAFAPGRDVGVFVVTNRADFARFSALTSGRSTI